VDPRAGLYNVEKRKIFDPNRDSICHPSVVQPVASRYTDCATPAPEVGVWMKLKVAQRHAFSISNIDPSGSTTKELITRSEPVSLSVSNLFH
jgi:hypothetical protein